MPEQTLAIQMSRDTFLEPFVGGPAFRLRQASGEGMPLAEAIVAMELSGARFAHIRVASEDANTASALLEAGFDPVETLVTWARALGASPPRSTEIRLRHARAEDLPACRRIAEEAFVHNRFSRDTRMDQDAARRLKGEWMANNFAGRADAILVTLDDDDVTGFIACLLSGPDAIVDLIAVAPAHQGAGIGRALLDAAASAYAGRAESFRAGTQADNAASTRMYRNAGFEPVSSQNTFHRWWPA